MLRAGLLGAVVIALDVLAGTLGVFAGVSLWLWWRPLLGEVLPFTLPSFLMPNPFMPPGMLLVLGWLLALRSEGLYDPGQMTSSARIARGITRATAMVCVGVVLAHFFASPKGWSRALILFVMAAMSSLTGLLRLVFFRVQAHLPRPIAPVRVVIVGVGEDADGLSARIRRYGHGAYAVAGFIRSGSGERQTVPDELVLGDVADFSALVNQHDLRMVVLTAFALGRDEALTLATRADQMGLKVFQVPFTWGAVSPRVDLARVGDLQLIDLTVLSYPSWAEFMKRIMDLLLVAVGGLLLAPLLALVALVVKLQDGGPVLFVQPRAGRGGRQFPFFKFRSMVVDAEERRAGLQEQNETDGVLFKIADDPRVTPLGRFIRRWSIDELPQLWNVVRGDMNLVGPRPLPMRDLEGADADPEIRYWMELRGKVKPGITGPWQVSGRSNLGFQDMVELDIAYVQNWTLWADLLILLHTLPAVLRRRGAH